MTLATSPRQAGRAIPRALPRPKPRDAVIALVIAAHGLLIWLLVHHTRIELESSASASASASAASGGRSIAVQLVSRPAAAAPVSPAPPAPVPVPRPVATPRKAPAHTKAPPVLNTEAPSTREVARRAPLAAAAPPPSVTTSAPVQPAASATPATAATPSNDATHPPAPGASRPSLDTKQISSGDMARLGCRIPAPVYPAKARRLGQAGVVTLRVTVAADGHVARALVSRSSGYPALDDAAVEALQAGRCQPYLENGMPRQVEASQPIAFHLDD
ncbi:energy transducer TonB [Burkholderia sp. 22PA0106]|uniref:energy transducer TonB n=1 Tax=Burkholderia sp. 22PA0106 TaxID=3237371 RepID=UPI0039C4605C